MSSCSCGHELNSDDRFCSRCGRSASTADSSPFLLGQDQNDSIETSSEVNAGFPMRWAVVGVLAVGAMMWGLFAWPQAESTIGDEDTADALDADDSAEQDDAEEESAQDGSSEKSVEESVEEAEAEEEPEPPVSTTNDGAAQEGDDDDPSDPGEPVVGELTGYGLVIGGIDSGRLRIVSLDTGERVEVPGMRGGPVGMIGTTLVTNNWDSIYTLDLAAEELEPNELRSSSDWVGEVFIEDDLIWALTGSFDNSEQRLVGRSLDGEEVDSREVNLQFFYTRQSDPTLATSDGGGVYVRSGTEFKRLSTGTLRASGDRLVLVDECDSRMRCEGVFYERDSWERLDLPSPPELGFGWSSIEGGDRWLANADFTDGTLELIEIATGTVVRSLEQQEFNAPGSPISISEDGRWLFEPAAPGSQGSIVDLDTSKTWPVEATLRSDSVARFIDLSGTVLDPG